MIDSDNIDEPKLSYERILNDLADIIRTDSITSSCLHNKFFAIGTLYGRIHVFDHQGNKVDGQQLCVHLKPVNCISIDEKGEYLVSCSDDRLAVYGLFNSEHNLVLMLDKPMNVVAIDPYFHKPGSGRRFVAGDDKLVLYERGFLAFKSKYKTTVLQSKEQKVRTLSWHGQFIAWATDVFVQIFDVDQRAIITRIKRDSDVDLSHGFNTCQFCWREKRTLLIGWYNTIKVCLIKERSHEVLNDTQLKELPKKYVEIVSMFETDFTVCGLAPFNDSLLTLSFNNLVTMRQRSISRDTQLSCDSSFTSSQGVVTSPASETSSIDILNTSDIMVKPQVHILETFSNSYNVLSKDILTPNATTKQTKSSKTFPYSLLSLHEDGIYLVVCPKDVISAKPRDFDDHIDWLMEHSMLKECCSFAQKYSSKLSRHSVREVEELYMKELLDTGTSESYSEAAILCASICGTNHKSWDDAIEKFCDLRQLKHLLPVLPRRVDKFCLKQDSYNFILEEFLENDSVSFFRAIKEIPSQLYSLDIMTDQVIRSLANDPKNLVLNEALAELYTQKGEFENAVNIYLEYNDRNRIFSLIRNNNLTSILRNRAERLMQIDADETSQLLVENLESIKMKDIVERLEKYKSKRYLISYLDRLFLKDPECCIEYHNLMVKLYAQHRQPSLLKFLKLSTNYRLEEALTICEEYKLIKEAVFLYCRMGDLRSALQCIIGSQGDINGAIEFCKEHQDPELWRYLIVYSVEKPEFIATLLKNIDISMIDPVELIDRIPEDCEIEGLMPALVKILQDYQMQISLEQSCRDLMAKDCFSLLQKQIDLQSKGIAIDVDQVCDHCNEPLFNDSNAEIPNQPRPLGVDELEVGLPGSSRGQVGACGPSSSSNDLVVFGCHHVFHEECCTDSRPTIESGSKILTCRVCMLEDDDENTSAN